MTYLAKWIKSWKGIKREFHPQNGISYARNWWNSSKWIWICV